VTAHDPESESLTVTWSTTGGTLGTQTDTVNGIYTTSDNTLVAPTTAGTVTVTATISDGAVSTAVDFTLTYDGWTGGLQGGGAGEDKGESIAVDSDGNFYVTGSFEGTANFGGTVLTSAGGSDVFVVMLNASGDIQWAARAGGAGADRGVGVGVDSADNAYIAGSFSGTADFSSTTLTSAGAADLFVTRVGSGGSFTWAVRAGGSADVSASSVAVDTSGNTYVTGGFFGTATFGSTTLTSVGDEDIYVTRVNSGGAFQWTRPAGSVVADSGRALSMDSSGNLYLTGMFGGPVVGDMFVARMDQLGQIWWVNAGGSISFDDSASIAQDAAGNIYVLGTFQSTAMFGTTTLTSAGGDDLYVAQLMTTGAFGWVVRAGGSGPEAGGGLAVGSSGTIYATGSFLGPANFGATTLTSAGNADIYFTALNSSGTFTSAIRAGGSANDHGAALVVGSAGNAYITGFFQGTATFGATTLTATGGSDFFVWGVEP